MTEQFAVSVDPEAPEWVLEAVYAVVHVVEVVGVVVVCVGVLVALARLVGAASARTWRRSFVPIRLDFGRFLALGLDFQLAGDIARTAVSPGFSEIGRLAAIAAIRTALNFFLSREIRAEEEELERRGVPEDA